MMTKPPEGEGTVAAEPEGLAAVGRNESTWLARMQARASRQRLNGRSKFVPHQGQREKARRLRQVER